MIAQVFLKEMFDYCPDNGCFVRKVSRSNAVKAGERAGTRLKNGYRQISISGRAYYEHRLAWFYIHGEWPRTIDHINGQRDDNRISNLRSVTHAENLRNQKQRKDNSSGSTGVSYAKNMNKYEAYITMNQKKINLGYYESVEEAKAARKAAEKIHGFHQNHGRLI